MVCVIAAFAYWKLTPKKLNVSAKNIVSTQLLTIFLNVSAKNIVSNYVAEGDARAEKALETLSSGDTSYAEKTLKEWSDIGNDDRYYKHKRKIMLALSQHLLSKKNIKNRQTL